MIAQLAFRIVQDEADTQIQNFQLSNHDSYIYGNQEVKFCTLLTKYVEDPTIHSGVIQRQAISDYVDMA